MVLEKGAAALRLGMWRGRAIACSLLLCAVEAAGRGRQKPWRLGDHACRPCAAVAHLTAADGPALPLTGVVPPARRRLAAAAPLGRAGGPAIEEAVEQEQELLLPRDALGQPIASAAWVGLGPDGAELPAAARRKLAQVTPLPPAKFVTNTLITRWGVGATSGGKRSGGTGASGAEMLRRWSPSCLPPLHPPPPSPSTAAS